MADIEMSLSKAQRPSRAILALATGWPRTLTMRPVAKGKRR
jgi:hypothetical protein